MAHGLRTGLLAILALGASLAAAPGTAEAQPWRQGPPPPAYGYGGPHYGPPPGAWHGGWRERRHEEWRRARWERRHFERDHFGPRFYR